MIRIQVGRGLHVDAFPRCNIIRIGPLTWNKLTLQQSISLARAILEQVERLQPGTDQE